jgi:tetratricopeptide (TPR) repeat protein
MARAFQAQMSGDLTAAIELYRRSIAALPHRGGAHVPGWTYSFQGRLEDAIEECHKAIAVDPTFGNPYNDIGAYLIEMGRLDDAIPWLERATHATRYASPEFPALQPRPGVPGQGDVFAARFRSSWRWWICSPTTVAPAGGRGHPAQAELSLAPIS